MSQEPEPTIDDEMRAEYDFQVVFAVSIMKLINNLLILSCWSQMWLKYFEIRRL